MVYGRHIVIDEQSTSRPVREYDRAENRFKTVYSILRLFLGASRRVNAINLPVDRNLGVRAKTTGNRCPFDRL